MYVKLLSKILMALLVKTSCAINIEFFGSMRFVDNNMRVRRWRKLKRPIDKL